jgi:hypothetical protein
MAGSNPGHFCFLSPAWSIQRAAAALLITRRFEKSAFAQLCDLIQRPRARRCCSQPLWSVSRLKMWELSPTDSKPVST